MWFEVCFVVPCRRPLTLPSPQRAPTISTDTCSRPSGTSRGPGATGSAVDRPSRSPLPPALAAPDLSRNTAPPLGRPHPRPRVSPVAGVAGPPGAVRPQAGVTPPPLGLARPALRPRGRPGHLRARALAGQRAPQTARGARGRSGRWSRSWLCPAEASLSWLLLREPLRAGQQQVCPGGGWEGAPGLACPEPRVCV